MSMLTRRGFLAAQGALALAAQAHGAQDRRPRVAAVITEFRRNSHAEVIVGRMLRGYHYEGRRCEPRVEVVSMYTDQVPDNDMSRDMAAAHGVRIFPTVARALTMDGSGLAVDGVVFVGEHGNYHWNIRGQKLYPRWYLYSQIVGTFRRTGTVAPVFNDKHLSVDWDEAAWMHRMSREMGFPLLAGSSLPLTWRFPELELEPEAPVRHAVACFYGGIESYGFHALESLQCMVERREGGETGIAAVRGIAGPDAWSWTDANPWAGRLLDAALERCAGRKPGSPRTNAPEPVVFVLEYADGLTAAVYLLNGHIQTTGFAAGLRGGKEPVSTELRLQGERPYGHFSGLVRRIEDMVLDGAAPYPSERTLLTTGALAALMESIFRGGRRMETPHLAVTYRAPAGSLYQRGPMPPALENFGIGP